MMERRVRKRTRDKIKSGDFESTGRFRDLAISGLFFVQDSGFILFSSSVDFTLELPRTQ